MQVYPKVKEQLLSWALTGSTPANVSLAVCGVDATYVFDIAHDTLVDLGDSVVIAPQDFQHSTLTDGVVKAFPASLTNVTPGPTLTGLVVMLKWLGGTQLCCFIDESTDASLPQEIASTAFAVLWDSDGVFKI